ncbi:MAG: CoA transferase [archaeon]|nr:CoA transferase [archaeon]
MFSLKDIRVLDLSQNVAGPYAGMILAEFGAEVLKVESPDGDPTRTWGPPFWSGESPTYLALNRNKLRRTLDLKSNEGLKEVKNRLRITDVLLVSSRPGAMSKFGLDYESLKENYPKLIYAEITAFGQQGPRASESGYDPLMQAMAGLMSVTGRPQYEPIRVGVSIIDMAAGMWTALGVFSALNLRSADGKGHRVNVSLYETAIAWMTIPLHLYWASGVVPVGFGSGVASIVPYEAFKTEDGWIVIGGGNDRLFGKISHLLGRKEWASDSRFKTNADRVTNRTVLHELIQDITRKKSSKEWEQEFKNAGIPAAPVLNVSQVLEEAQLKNLGIIQSIEHPNISGYNSVGLPISIDGKRPPLRIPPT